jgi:prepilin-type N-terminal cleavage/methylation domain-containing protein
VKNIFLKLLNKKKADFGFTLIEVLVSIGLIGTMIIMVAYTTTMNKNELFRHNAESYADLIASNQFSMLVAYRNQIAFDDDPSTNWKTLESKVGPEHVIMSDNSDNNCSAGQKFCFVPPSPVAEKINSQSSVDLNYYMVLSSMNDSQGHPNLIKAYLQVSYQDRNGQTVDKDYYTIIGNYL